MRSSQYGWRSYENLMLPPDLTGGRAQAVMQVSGERLWIQMKFLCLMLTSCCAALFLTGHRLVVVCGQGVGDPTIAHWCLLFHACAHVYILSPFKKSLSNNIFISEWGRKEEHWFVAFHTHSDQGLNPQHFGVWDDASTSWATQQCVSPLFLISDIPLDRISSYPLKLVIFSSAISNLTLILSVHSSSQTLWFSPLEVQFESLCIFHVCT